uniref:PHD-type domain-containing protein n=1 Tax=Panagrolaimus sp. ES5 TaxID=591445 RepID=A0AC34G5M0_9BILA
MPPPETKLFSPIQTQKDYRTFLVMDRHKLMAQACARYPEQLQLGDDIREWMKEIDNLDDYSEKLIEDIKIQQKIERDSITAENFRQLREAQIKIRGLIRRLKITVEQKAEVNDKIEKFLDEFSANLPLIFAETKQEEPQQQVPAENNEQTSFSSSASPTSTTTTNVVVITSEIVKNEIEILKRAKEFAAVEWKIEQSYIQANASKAPTNIEYEAEEYDLPPPPSSGRGRRPQLNTTSPKKSLNRSLASPRRAKKPASPEEMPEEESQPPPEKKAKTSLLAAASAPAVILSGKRRKSGGNIRKSSEPKTPKPPSTPEEIAAKKEERAKVKKAKAEEQQKQQTEAEEIARLTAQLELEGDIPKRRAAATAAANAIHSATIHIPKTPVTTTSSLSKSTAAPKEKESSIPATPTTPPTTAAAATAITLSGRKRSMTKKVLRKSSQQQKDETEEEETYCICKEISYGEMICCDNEGCKIQWFHFGCVGLKIKPKRGLNWYCIDCRGEKSSIMKKK